MTPGSLRRGMAYTSRSGGGQQTFHRAEAGRALGAVVGQLAGQALYKLDLALRGWLELP